MKSALILFSFICAAGCSTISTKKDSLPPEPAVSKESSTKAPKGSVTLEEDANVDLKGVQRILGIDRDRNDLGIIERAFNTCDVGSGYSKVKNCRKKIFGLIHFRLQCRDTSGTTSEIVTSADLTSMSNHDLTWSMKSAKGDALTDSQGYAQIRYAVDGSQRGQRLRVGTKTDFLYLKADEIKQVIVPNYWCQ